jgi:cobalt-zinc-cadmium resistance protein CzcA
LSSPSNLVYRYVIESPDRTPQELKTYEDWVIERAYKSVPGVADDSGFGGTVMQYQVLLDPAKIYSYHIPLPQVLSALAANNANAGGGFYSQGSQFFYVRGLGLVTKTEDIGDIVVGNNNGVPVRIRDIGEVTIGHAPRLGEFGFQNDDDRRRRHPHAHRRADAERPQARGRKDQGDQPRPLPPDVKVRPYYDRSDLVQVTIDTVEHNMLLGMALVLIVLIFFLVSVRAAIIVALTIPLSLLFSFIFPARTRHSGEPAFHWRHRFRNHHRRHGRDDGKHPPRAGRATRAGVQPSRSDHRGGARRGPAHFLFHRRHPRRLHSHLRAEWPVRQAVPSHGGNHVLGAARLADLHSHAGSGARLLLVHQGRVKEKTNRAYDWLKDEYAAELRWCLDRPNLTMVLATMIFVASLFLIPFIGGEFMPHLDEGAMWVRATMPYTISFEEAAKFAPQIRKILMGYPMVTEVGSSWPAPMTAPTPPAFSTASFTSG